MPVGRTEESPQQFACSFGFGQPAVGGVHSRDPLGRGSDEPTELIEIGPLPLDAVDEPRIGDGIRSLVAVRRCSSSQGGLERVTSPSDLDVPIAEPADHSDLSGQPLPGRRADVGTVDAQRSSADQRHHPISAPALRRQLERGEQCATADRIGEAGAGRTVRRDLGGIELLLEDADIGIGSGVEHADAVEGKPGCGQSDDRTNDGPHLLVGVGDRDDAIGDRDAGRGEGFVDLDADGGTKIEHRPIGVFCSGEADDRGEPADALERPHEPRQRRRHRRRQIPDDRPERFGVVGEI